METKSEIILQDGDYIAHDGLWVTVQNAAIRIVPGKEGVSVFIYKNGAEDDGAVTQTWAGYDELEADFNAT